MAQGSKYSDEIKEKAFALLVSNNAAYVAKQLDLPYTTVKTWEEKFLKQAMGEGEKKEKSVEKKGKKSGEVEKPTKTPTKKSTNYEEESLIELRKKKKEEFIKKAWGTIDLAQEVLEKRLLRARDSEEQLDALVEEIMQLDYKTLTSQQRQALYNKLAKIKVEDVKGLATVLGTLYDKQALANKEATTIVDGTLEIKKFEDY